MSIWRVKKVTFTYFLILYLLMGHAWLVLFCLLFIFVYLVPLHLKNLLCLSLEVLGSDWHSSPTRKEPKLSLASRSFSSQCKTTSWPNWIVNFIFGQSEFFFHWKGHFYLRWFGNWQFSANVAIHLGLILDCKKSFQVFNLFCLKDKITFVSYQSFGISFRW